MRNIFIIFDIGRGAHFVEWVLHEFTTIYDIYFI